nr:serine hydrolase [Gemmatimonadota bacterium]
MIMLRLMTLLRRAATAMLCCACHTLGAQAADTRLAAGVDSIAHAVLASTGVPSASVAVVQHGRVVYAKAYG